MRTTCFGLVLVAGLSLPVNARAADNTVVGVGTGAVAGAVVGGPIGAVIGAVAGGFIGSSADSRPRYRRRARAGSSGRRAAAPLARQARLVSARVPEDLPPSAPPPRAGERRSGSEIEVSPPARGWQEPR